jgi:hypothetical protein
MRNKSALTERKSCPYVCMFEILLLMWNSPITVRHTPTRVADTEKIWIVISVSIYSFEGSCKDMVVNSPVL